MVEEYLCLHEASIKSLLNGTLPMGTVGFLLVSSGRSHTITPLSCSFTKQNRRGIHT